MKYRFLGTYSEVMGVGRLAQYGQAIELDEKLAAELSRKLQIIPETDFQKLGHTPEELQKFALAQSHASAPESFLAKKRAALVILHEQREKALRPNTEAHGDPGISKDQPARLQKLVPEKKEII